MTGFLIPRVLGISLAAAACLWASTTNPARAQTSAYPTRAITMVVPFAPGGGTDVAARALAGRLADRLQQPVVIENKGGAGGNIGAAAVARAAPDGYTLLFTAQSPITIAQHLQPKPGFNAARDFMPIAIAVTSPELVVVNASMPVESLADLASYSKKNPGKIFFGSPGRGTEIHLTGELIKTEARITMEHVPYKGSGPALSDLLSGQIHVMVASPGQVKSHINSGRLRAIAILSQERDPAFPNVHTATEDGWPKLQMEFWFGVLAPRGTPPGAINRLVKALEEINAEPEYRARLEGLSMKSQAVGPGEFARVIQTGSKTWGDLLKKVPVDTLD